MGTSDNHNFIHLENLSKSYTEGNKKRNVLQGATASTAKGEFLAIIGKSGSGKSTLLNLISGTDSPDSGEIHLNEQSLTGLSENDRTLFRRENIGFIFQFFNLIPTLKVIENVTLPLELTGVALEEARKTATKFLAAVGLDDREGAFPDRLSGGEQQRVAIARALVHDPLLVLADEPTGNLDEETGLQVLHLLEELTGQEGKNLIMVTHSMDNADHADRVLELRDGLLVEATLQEQFERELV
jgi:putative ABC transport system ATP-binding protein